jgi:hypothetical protein
MVVACRLAKAAGSEDRRFHSQASSALARRKAGLRRCSCSRGLKEILTYAGRRAARLPKLIGAARGLATRFRHAAASMGKPSELSLRHVLDEALHVHRGISLTAP